MYADACRSGGVVQEGKDEPELDFASPLLAVSKRLSESGVSVEDKALLSSSSSMRECLSSLS